MVGHLKSLSNQTIFPYQHENAKSVDRSRTMHAMAGRLVQNEQNMGQYSLQPPKMGTIMSGELENRLFCFPSYSDCSNYDLLG